MGIRDEFDKAFESDERPRGVSIYDHKDLAIWAAKWAMERCIKTLEQAKVAAIIDQHEVSDEDAQRRGEDHNESMDIAIKEIRQLAKEME